MYRGVAGICFATLLFVCSAAGFPVAPGARPPANGQLVLGSPPQTTQIVEGGQLVVSGSGFHPTSNLTLALYSTPQTLASITTDAAGSFRTTVTVPQGSVGDHTVSAIGLAPNRSARVLEAPLKVVARSASPGDLARTGVQAALWTAGGIVLVVSGLVLVRTAALRRRILPLP